MVITVVGMQSIKNYSYNSNNMRTYIFTEREQAIIQDFLEGKITVRNPALSQIRTRINTPSLRNDIKLFITLRVALSTHTR